MSKLEKKGWSSSFTLIGKVVLNNNSFKLDQRSSKSDWVYSQANIGVACGGDYGTVYCEMNGGYGASRDNTVRVFTNQGVREIPWNDRFNENEISTLPDMSVIRVGLDPNDEKEKRFISTYDAINYLSEHLINGMDVYVYGNIRYTEYDGVVRARKEITNIRLPKATEEPRATFVQSVLLTRGCYNIVGDKAIVDGVVLEYMKKYKNMDVNSVVPLHYEFEYDLSKFKPEDYTDIMNWLVPMTDDVNEIKFGGEFINKGQTVQITYADLSDDIKRAIKWGMVTEEEALAPPAAGDGGVVRKMVLRVPKFKFVEDEFGKRLKQFEIFRSKYVKDDLNWSVEPPTEIDLGLGDFEFNFD